MSTHTDVPTDTPRGRRGRLFSGCALFLWGGLLIVGLLLFFLFAPQAWHTLRAPSSAEPLVRVIPPTATPTPSPTPPQPVPSPQAIVYTVYAVVRYVAYPGPDNILVRDVEARWKLPQGQSPGPLYLTNDAWKALDARFTSPPHPQADVYTVNSVDEMVQRLQKDPKAWGVIAFHQLVPALYPMKIDRKDVLDPMPTLKQLNDYPFTYHHIERNTWPHSNHEPDKFGVIWVTGATSLTGTWAQNMEGVAEGLKDLRKLFKGSTWVHTQLDVPVFETCDPTPKDAPCTSPKMLDVLVRGDFNLASLASPRVARFGTGGAMATGHLLEAKNIRPLGIGRIAPDALAMDWNIGGRTIALISLGVPTGPQEQWATATEPGVLPYTPENSQQLLNAITTLAHQRDSVVVFVRWHRTRDVEKEDQIQAFRRLRGAGADVVIGVQPGVMQRISYDTTGVMAYGLGSFLEGSPNRAQLLRLIFYDGRLIAAEPFFLQRTDAAWTVIRGENRQVLWARFVQ